MDPSPPLYYHLECTVDSVVHFHRCYRQETFAAKKYSYFPIFVIVVHFTFGLVYLQECSHAATQKYEYLLSFAVPYSANQPTTIGQPYGESERDEAIMFDKTS
mmetsp:Transcript_2655/g.5687  ORF Transcript_2655/g.5687 Transcript_2655/m.5687 type:complete len:103 (-) Transcript_2655:95-403(-)